MQSIDAFRADTPLAVAPTNEGVVVADSFLTLRYRLAGPDGETVIDTFGGPAATLSLGTGELAPPLEAKLVGLRAGERRVFPLAPGEAFGNRSEELLQRLGRASLAEATGEPGETYAVGDVVRVPTPDGAASIAGIVCAVDGETLVLDFNHPLAGRAATFEVELLAVL